MKIKKGIRKLDMKKTAILFCISLPLIAFGQDAAVSDSLKEAEVGSQEYVIVKDYKPVLSESYKISDSPEGDTATITVVPQTYSFESKRATTMYETGAIKAIKIKDEPLQKLYRSYLKAAGGNYSKYLGEFYIGSLRSKTGALGFNLKHLSGSPSPKVFGNAGYSTNAAKFDGKYFLSHATLDGDLNYRRDVVHYYGYKKDGTVRDKNQVKQVFSDLGANFSIASTYLDSSHLNYNAAIRYSDLTDKFSVHESELSIAGGVGKKMKETFAGMDVAMEFFKKDKASFESDTAENGASRNILRFRPYVAFDREKISFKAGISVESMQDLEASFHVFPRLDLKVPVADGVLHVFANVGGQVEKNNYHTITAENPFITPAARPVNTIRKFDIRGGVTGNFSRSLSFTGFISFAQFSDLQLFKNDSARIGNFDVMYVGTKSKPVDRFNLHAELNYRSGKRITASLLIDQFNYRENLGVVDHIWYRPNTVITLKTDYNLQDKIVLNVALFGVGQRYAMVEENTAGNTVQRSEKLKPYLDANLGVEYRYSKILSAFVTVNNLGFAKYQQWYGNPMERLNAMGGVTYCF